MGAFYESELMKKFLKDELEKEVLIGGLFLCFCLFGPVTFTSNHILWMVLFFYLTGEAFLFLKYLSYPAKTAGRMLLAGIVKYQAFDSEALFHKLAGKVGIMEVLMAVMVSISMVMYQRAGMIPAVFLLLLVPALFFFMSRSYFNYQLTYEPTTGQKIGEIVLYTIIGGILKVGLLVYGVIALFLIYGFVSDKWGANQFSDSMVVYCVYDNVWMGVMVILFCIRFVVPTFYKGKYDKQIKIVVWTAFLLCFVGSLVSERANNTVFVENRILHTVNFETREYVLEDVQSFQVSMGKDQMQMELVMKDGIFIKVVGNEDTSTEAWGEKYYSIYNYLSDLTDRLLSLGAEGSIRDVEAIRQFVKEFDPECVRGTEEIIDMLQ